MAAGLAQGLLETLGLLVVQALGMGDHDAPFDAEDDLGCLERPKRREAILVDDPVAAVGHGEQVGMVRRRQGPDEMER